MAQTRELYFYIHNVFGHFFKDMLDYFTDIYPRFEYRVMGVYDKATEFLAKKQQYGRETDKPILPALILNPTGDLLPADANAGGRQYFRYPNLSPSLAKRLFKPIYQDANLYIYPVFLRFKGEFELLMLLNSFYEFCDLRVLMINMFGGLDRIIYPRYFTSFIILPESFTTYEYYNEYTGLRYKPDWNSVNISTELVRSTARNELVLPLNIKPQIAMTNLSDASTRYGGSDKLADWRLTATINYEIEVPTYLVIESDYVAENLKLEFKYDSVYSAYSQYQPPASRNISNLFFDLNLDETSNSRISIDSTSEEVSGYDYIFQKRLFHIITEDQVDSTSNFEISLPDVIDDNQALIINSKYGAMSYGDHYIVSDDGTTLIIKVENVILEENMVLELYIYQRS
jgi:hypothetical protein